MKISRATFTFLTTAISATLLTSPARAVPSQEQTTEASSWSLASLGEWFEGMGEGFAQAFSGPKRTAPAFKWSGPLAAGKTIEVRGINGPIRAVSTDGSEVEVVAVRTGRRSDPESVKIEVVNHPGGVTVCAVYPSRDGERPNVCRPFGEGRMRVRNNDVNVEFEIRVPKGVNFEARTVNGGITAEVEGRAAVSTVNGGIEVHAGALTEATTVNGSIRAEVRNGGTTAGDVTLSTVNGSVRLSLPEGLNADVSAKTVNGGISSDFEEIEVQRKHGPRSAEGRLGSGGRELALSTVNGGIRISRGN